MRTRETISFLDALLIWNTEYIDLAVFFAKKQILIYTWIKMLFPQKPHYERNNAKRKGKTNSSNFRHRRKWARIDPRKDYTDNSYAGWKGELIMKEVNRQLKYFQHHKIKGRVTYKAKRLASSFNLRDKFDKTTWFIVSTVLTAISFTSGKANEVLKKEFSMMRAVIVTLMYISTHLLLVIKRLENVFIFKKIIAYW